MGALAGTPRGGESPQFFLQRALSIPLSIGDAVELYLLSCKFVFIHVAFHFEIYVANKVLICFPYQYNMMKLAVYLQEIISDLHVNY